MFNLFLSPEVLPFSTALAVTVGLLILELISALLGATVLGLGGEGVDLDMDWDFDLSADISVDSVDLEPGI